MARRRLPILLATRVTPRERALVDAAARIEGVSVTELLRRITLPEVRSRLLVSLEDGDTTEGSREVT